MQPKLDIRLSDTVCDVGVPALLHLLLSHHVHASTSFLFILRKTEEVQTHTMAVEKILPLRLLMLVTATAAAFVLSLRVPGESDVNLVQRWARSLVK